MKCARVTGPTTADKCSKPAKWYVPIGTHRVYYCTECARIEQLRQHMLDLRHA